MTRDERIDELAEKVARCAIDLHKAAFFEVHKHKARFRRALAALVKAAKETT